MAVLFFYLLTGFLCQIQDMSLAEFRRPQTTEEHQSVFFGGVYVEKNTAQTGKCANAVSACTRLQPR